MASVIKAGNATDGIAISSDNTGILELKTGTGAGTTAVTIGTNQAVTFAGAVTSSGNQTVTGNLTVNGNTTLGDANTDTILMTAAPSIGGAGLGMGFGFRNRIINGAMVIDQRNAGASYSPAVSTVVYGADRWLTFSLGAGVTAQRINNSGVTGLPFAFRQTGASGNTYTSFNQRIESANCLDLVGQQVTVSLLVATSNSSNVRIGLQYAGSTDNFNSPVIIQQQTIATTSTLTRYSLTFNALPSQVANGIQLDIEAASGIGAGVTFTITGVQLEKGSTATSFDYRPYGTELQLCQRYCFVMSGGSNRRYFYAGNISGTGLDTFPSRPFPVTFRSSSVSMTVSSNSHFTFETWASAQQVLTGLVLNTTTVDEVTVTATVGSAVATGGNVIGNNASAKITLSAEL